jgi:hypothetical protein
MDVAATSDRQGSRSEARSCTGPVVERDRIAKSPGHIHGEPGLRDASFEKVLGIPV